MERRVESDYTFTADSENYESGSCFTFDATSLDGKQLVTFEEIVRFEPIQTNRRKLRSIRILRTRDRRFTFKNSQKNQRNPKTPETRKALT